MHGPVVGKRGMLVCGRARYEFCARTLAAATVPPFRFVPTEMDERATTFAGLLAMLVVYEWWSESCESERHL